MTKQQKFDSMINAIQLLHKVPTTTRGSMREAKRKVIQVLPRIGSRYKNEIIKNYLISFDFENRICIKVVFNHNRYKVLKGMEIEDYFKNYLNN